MDGSCARRLREELDRVEKELAAARLLERQTEERHGREGSAEKGAVLEARRTRADLLGRERERLASELELRGSPRGSRETGVRPSHGRRYTYPSPEWREPKDRPRPTWK